jgi:hypothetical protein
LQENHNNSSVISQSSSNITETHQVNQTLQSINNNNNNNNSTIQKSKIHSNVDQQINDSSCKDEELLLEPNNNTNSNFSSTSRACFRNHPVSRRGTEFISQQVPTFRSFAGASNSRYITQKNKYERLI